MLRLYTLLLLLVLLPLWSPAGHAQIGISPQTFDITLGETRKSHSFRLFNLGDEPVEVEVSVANWQMDDNNRVQVIPSTPQSLDQWMIINPLRFTIAPKSSQAVRFAIRPAIELTPGEHRAIVYFDQVLGPDKDPDKATLRSRFRVGAAVYGQVGEPVRQGKLKMVRMQNTTAYLTIQNTGNANVRMQGNWSLWDASKFPGQDVSVPADVDEEQEDVLTDGMLATGVLPTTPILPADTRDIPLSLSDLETTATIPHDLILIIKGKIGENHLNETVPVVIPEPANAE